MPSTHTHWWGGGNWSASDRERRGKHQHCLAQKRGTGERTVQPTDLAQVFLLLLPPLPPFCSSFLTHQITDLDRSVPASAVAMGVYWQGCSSEHASGTELHMSGMAISGWPRSWLGCFASVAVQLLPLQVLLCSLAAAVTSGKSRREGLESGEGKVSPGEARREGREAKVSQGHTC